MKLKDAARQVLRGPWLALSLGLMTLVVGPAADGRVSDVALSIDHGVRFGLPNAPRAADRVASLVGMTSAWLDVMEVRLLAGRRLTGGDDDTTAMLSAGAAALIAPGTSPLGMVVRVTQGSGAARDVRIVGIVADTPLRPTADRPAPVIYVTSAFREPAAASQIPSRSLRSRTRSRATASSVFASSFSRSSTPPSTAGNSS